MRVLTLVINLHVAFCTLMHNGSSEQRHIHVTSHGNMNALANYTIANPLPGHEGKRQSFVGEYFEVYSPPIRSKYSEVFWTSLPAVPIPQEISTRYSNRIMAVTGWEVDVVRKTDKGDVSVPCYESYNHHYGATLVGKKAQLSDRPGPDHGHGPTLLFEAEDGPAWIPQVQAFNENNGNEARGTYHGLPRPYVQPIESPDSFIMMPMQINTRNPDGSGKRGGPLPRAALPNVTGRPLNASYSALLECPCSTRRKKVVGQPVSRSHGMCGETLGRRPDPDQKYDPWALHSNDSGDWPLNAAQECFDAASALLGRAASSNKTISNSSYPPYCSILPLDESALQYSVIFNTLHTSGTTCGSSAQVHAIGYQHDLVSLSLDVNEATGKVKITMEADDGKWFGVGFGAAQMSDLPYAIIVDGHGTISERKLADHLPGKSLPTSVQVVSNTVVEGKRTVVMSRDVKGASEDYYTFKASESNLPFINAIGASADFGYHKVRAASSITLLGLQSRTCVCRKKGGTIDGIPFDPRCPAWPLSDLAKNKNPMCDVSTYVGGIQCCKNGDFLLDEDQEIPDYVDEVYYKWRFYFEDWDPLKHIQAVHLEWALNGCDSGGGHMGCRSIEYDIPRAPPGTSPEKAVHTVESHFTASDMLTPCDPRTSVYCADPKNVTSAGVFLIMAAGHCHAPACLSIELWNEDTGESLCRIEPVFGTGDEALNEQGYLWLPHCAWGNAQDGLKPPPVLHAHTKLKSIKRENSTHYHYGVMAIWQMRAAFLVPSSDVFV